MAHLGCLVSCWLVVPFLWLKIRDKNCVFIFDEVGMIGETLQLPEAGSDLQTLQKFRQLVIEFHDLKNEEKHALYLQAAEGHQDWVSKKLNL